MEVSSKKLIIYIIFGRYPEKGLGFHFSLPLPITIWIGELKHTVQSLTQSQR